MKITIDYYPGILKKVNCFFQECGLGIAYKEGYRQTSETVSNHWYCLTGLEYKPVPNLKWFLNYNYAKPYIAFSSDIVTDKKPIDLGYISFGLKAALIDIFSFL